MRALIAAAMAVLLSGSIAVSDPLWTRSPLGTARLFTNDAIGDGRDRYQTGSYQVSHFRGEIWQGTHAERAGQVIEYRLGTRIVAPENLRNPQPGDRRYAGVLSFGVHTPFARGPWEFSAGGDLVITGPQTGIGEFQDIIHDWVGAAKPDLSNQIDNGFHPTGSLVAARSLSFGQATVRPFAELQAGYETFARVGVDVLVGTIGQGGLFSRDVTTGTLMRADYRQAPGVSFVAGADFAALSDSVLLPSEDGIEPTDRTRARAGVQWQADQRRVYYGLTWLSEEFEGQSGSQVVGSLTVDFSF